ncbi:CDT1-like protein b [Rutidosis leptorrhynchoides]|uniref:CDT1-like protein b n=1 Tax=Rutidosis leptorrhynchoides TaxID=125765 RepID=UPI003A98FAD7
MDHKLQGEQTEVGSGQHGVLPTSDKLCSESFTPVKKLHDDGMQLLDISLVSPTPEKTNETVNMRSKKEPVQLPEKYELLSELFNCMITSVRLLNLQKQLPIFRNICRQVEILTERKFTYKNLAQIKFIIPEAVQTDRILLHNKKTLCMEPDIKVTLLFDVVEGHVEHSAYLALSRLFSSKLSKFVNTHSEDSDVPVAELPDPFNQRETTVSVNLLPATKESANVNEAELLNPSILPPSFKRHFSVKAAKESAKTDLLPSPLAPSSLESDTTINTKVTNEDTPMKIPSILGEMSIVTPDLSTPKRSVPTEDKQKSVLTQKPIASSLFAKRFLDFSNDEDVCLEKKMVHVDILFWPIGLVGNLCRSSWFKEVESGTIAEGKSCNTSKNDVITQSGLKLQQDISGCLSALAKTMYNIFQSANRSLITKRELVYKILVNNIDIEETVEIEEQIELLVKKVPDWISKKDDPSGDYLYNINRGLDLKSITERLL